MAVAVAEN